MADFRPWRPYDTVPESQDPCFLIGFQGFWLAAAPQGKGHGQGFSRNGVQQRYVPFPPLEIIRSLALWAGRAGELGSLTNFGERKLSICFKPLWPAPPTAVGQKQRDQNPHGPAVGMGAKSGILGGGWVVGGTVRTPALKEENKDLWGENPTERYPGVLLLALGGYFK